MITDLHSLAAPYVLGALDAAETAEFETHLERCEDCVAELAGFEATAARLAEASAQTPPATLKPALMRSIGQTAQERPVVVALADRRTRRILPRIALAAAALLTALSIGGYISEHNQKTDLQAERAAVIKIMGANDTEISSTALDNGGNAKMIASKETDEAVLLTDNLPSLDDGRVYQLWAITGQKPTSAGLIDSGSNIRVLKSVSGVDQVALTVEPAGGSKQPTTKPIAMMSAA